MSLLVLFGALALTALADKGLSFDVQTQCIDLGIPDVDILCFAMKLDSCETRASLQLIYGTQVLVSITDAELADYELCSQIENCDICVSFRDDYIFNPSYAKACPILSTTCRVGKIVTKSNQYLNCLEIGVNCEGISECVECTNTKGCGWCSGGNHQHAGCKFDGADGDASTSPYCGECLLPAQYYQSPNQCPSMLATTKKGVDVTLGKNKAWIIAVVVIGVLVAVLICVFICRRRKARRVVQHRQFSDNDTDSASNFNGVLMDRPASSREGQPARLFSKNPAASFAAEPQEGNFQPPSETPSGHFLPPA